MYYILLNGKRKKLSKETIFCNKNRKELEEKELTDSI
jgi:hypothetical protein